MPKKLSYCYNGADKAVHRIEDPVTMMNVPISFFERKSGYTDGKMRSTLINTNIGKKFNIELDSAKIGVCELLGFGSDSIPPSRFKDNLVTLSKKFAVFKTIEQNEGSFIVIQKGYCDLTPAK